MQSTDLKRLLIPSLLGLAIVTGSAQAAAPLRPPQGYYAPVDKFCLLYTSPSPRDS